MIKPDVIITHAMHVDWPMFRYQIRQYRHLYDKVIIGFSNHWGGLELQEAIKCTMVNDQITFIDPESYPQGDWRDVVVNKCLEQSTSSHILFLEQDFIIHNPKLLEFAFSQGESTVGFQEGKLDRLHPAFLLVSKEKLDKTNKNFSANPPHWDHFGEIRIDLKAQGDKPILLNDSEYQSPQDWEHLAGTNQNYTLLIRNEPANYRTERFAEYNRQILALDIEQIPEFLPYIWKASQNE